MKYHGRHSSMTWMLLRVISRYIIRRATGRLISNMGFQGVSISHSVLDPDSYIRVSSITIGLPGRLLRRRHNPLLMTYERFPPFQPAASTCADHDPDPNARNPGLAIPLMLTPGKLRMYSFVPPPRLPLSFHNLAEYSIDVVVCACVCVYSVIPALLDGFPDTFCVFAAVVLVEI